jgi:hypothetical protein
MHKALADLKGELITYSQKLWIFQTKYSCRGKVTAKVGAQVVCKKRFIIRKNISMVKWALLNRSLVKKF